MNRFRTRRKVKEEAAPRASNDSDSSAPFRLFSKNKKLQEVEPKKAIDLETALPSSDDFRTSLLMTGLSARFSMLKEQDDPASKIGKASDDSVLFPKRQSRMNFALGDIAEVESIKAPPPPFARMDSFNSSDDSTTASVMDRGKPLERNNLFGGRQKIYKIPTSASSTKNLGGMGGKALYESDVAMSSFQKWRQTERGRESSEDERSEPLVSSLDVPRSDSPPPTAYDRKRETNSTMSSAPSVGRNSTAATSIASQTPASIKDWQSTTTTTTTAPSSAAGTPNLERHVTRTRRLYEAGLINGMQEHQSSAVSRMDTLSRRNLGARTPELSNGPSPTSNKFPDRFADRKLMTKASAPNLRSMSPPLAVSTAGTMDLGIRMPGSGEAKSPLTSGASPLSPPISEAEDQMSLSIQPNDHGKATALGMFNKPAQAYDESKYAQKQLQLQQGRAESPADLSNSARERSRSSSARRTPSDRQDHIVRTEPTVKEETAISSGTFLDMDMEEEMSPRENVSSQAALSRPNPHNYPFDQEHTSSRSNALPTPLSMSSKASEGPSPLSEQPELLVSASSPASPPDSPTLGPTTGLSGIVRQHLRSDSDASSVYGTTDQTPDKRTSKYPHGQYDPANFSDMEMPSNPWDAQYRAEVTEPESQPHPENASDGQSAMKGATPIATSVESAGAAPSTSTERGDDKDEFAQHLADGARRVRERLTSYVESDSRSSSPHAPVDREPLSSRSNGLNILRPKSSRSRSRSQERQQQGTQSSNPTKLLSSIGSSAFSNSPSPSNRSFETERGRGPLPPMHEEPEKAGRENESEKQPQPQSDSAPEAHEDGDDQDEGMHAGLRAFRQARRELQKVRELETQQRHQVGPVQDRSPGSADGEDAIQSRATSGERANMPTAPWLQQRSVSDEPKSSFETSHDSSRPSSRADRNRSGSENSNSSRSASRPPRLRNISTPYDGRGPGGPPNVGSPRRTPGLPGTDVKRSPIMPPQGPASGSRDRSISGGVRLQPQLRGHESNQTSPISPMAPMPSPYMKTRPSMPNLGPSARQPAGPAPPIPEPHGVGRFDDSTRRAVRKRDISEPTFISSTSRVPAVAIGEDGADSRSGGPRSRSGSVLASAASTPNLHAYAKASSPTQAPPLPPINPRRRNMSIMREPKSDEDYRAGSPQLGFPRQEGGVAASSDPAAGPGPKSESPDGQRGRLRKATSEANVRARQAQFGGARVPPPMPTHSPHLPGGMF